LIRKVTKRKAVSSLIPTSTKPSKSAPPSLRDQPLLGKSHLSPTLSTKQRSLLESSLVGGHVLPSNTTRRPDSRRKNHMSINPR
jgi:hypothetical protein